MQKIDVEMHQIYFLLFVLAGLWVGRRLGWGISKLFLYTVNTSVAVIVCVVWGASVAFIVRIAMNWLQPWLIFKILGFGAGAYVSDPCYGLFVEATIPPDKLGRHDLISALPFLTYIATFVVLVLVR